jgi:hypothetical protein
LPRYWGPNGTRSFDFSQDSDPSSSQRSRQPTLPTLHPAQQQIFDERRRFNVLALGRRTGKTTLAQRLLAETAMAGQPGGYFAPTYKLLEEFFRELKLVLTDQTVAKSEQQHRLELGSGGTIECWSMDSGDPARGRKYARVVLDEAAMVPRLSDTWAQAIRPTLTDYQGDAWFNSTPRGLNDFHRLFQRGQDALEPEWASWQMPTSVNPYIAPQEIESARHDLTEREFAQEYEARFLVIEGAGVFRGLDAVARLKPQAPQRYDQYVIGVDWARDLDFSVFSIINASTREQVAMDRFNQIDWEFQTERLHRWVKAYKPRLIVAEANAMGGPVISRLQSGYYTLTGDWRPALPVMPWTATNASKAGVIQALSLALEQGELTLLDDVTQKGELQAFETSVTQTGMVRYAAPEGMHDDTVIALALAWSGASLDSAPRRTSYAFSGPG